ncbi:NAD(P)/FAD-dependent oxidoreductase [Nocardioides marmoraquaticus]
MSETSDLPVVVVGAGIAGAACARALREADVPVRVLDRGRRPGGRMASRRWPDGSRSVDLGASYLTVGDDDFRAVVDDWAARGLAREWTDTFTVLAADAAPEDKDGPVRWGATPSLRALVEDLAADLDVEHAAVERVERADDRWTVDGVAARAVVLAMPDPQALRLLSPGAQAYAADLQRGWEPVLALAARWERRTWDDLSPSGTFHGAFVNGDDVVAWVADDGRRRGDDAPVLTAHSTPGFAAQHLEDPAAAGPAMVAALRERLGIEEPLDSLVQRWTFAKPAGEREAPYLLRDGLGVCGDGWGPASKVETAWVSGHRLGQALAESL